MGDQKNSDASIGLQMLQVAFIVLKVLDKINWSWWWVLSPLWASFLFVCLLAIIYKVFMRYWA